MCFHPLDRAFCRAEVLNFSEIANLSHFPFMDDAFGISLRTLCLTLDAKGFLSVFP